MIKVKISGSQKILKIINLIPNRMKLALLKGMQETVIAIQSQAKKNAPIWRGLLRASLVQTVTVEGNKIIGQVGSALPYASVMERGRTTGWFPNVDQLKLWSRRKFGTEEAAYVIGRAIKRRGFAPQPYLGPAVETVGPRVQLIFTQRVLDALRDAGGG